MEEQKNEINIKVIQEMVNKYEIPYYSFLFKRLFVNFEKKIASLKTGEVDIMKAAELQIVLNGIHYYLDIIRSERFCEVDEQQKKKICKQLAESMNKAIYVLWNESISQKQVERLMAYQEYLQGVHNAFKHEQVDAPPIIYIFAHDLLSSKVHMDSLFTKKYEIADEVSAPLAFLCTVFVPTDEADDVFHYLPKLTHEVSHNFKYSKTKTRNNFIIGYMWEHVSAMMIRRMLKAAAGETCNMFIGKAEKILAKSLAKVLEKEFRSCNPHFEEKGHLDSLPSLMYSLICAPLKVNDDVEAYYSVKEDAYSVLKKAFMGLAELSKMDWYLIGVENVDVKLEIRIITSLFMDILIEEKPDQMEWYREVQAQNEKYRNAIKEMLDTYVNNTLQVDMELVIEAAEEIMCSVLQRLQEEFKDCQIPEELLTTLWMSMGSKREDFEGTLNAIIESDKVPDDNMHIVYELVDSCISAKNYLDTIYYLHSSFGRFIHRKSVSSEMLKGVYRSLYGDITRGLSDKMQKPYLASREIHSIIIRLGLLNDKPDIFVENYISMLTEWTGRNMFSAINEFLMLYREVFADLSMCAVFRFNPYGYLKYMMEQFAYETEMEQGIASNMALERVQAVLHVLERDYTDEEMKKFYRECGQFEYKGIKNWDRIVMSYVRGGRKDGYTEYDDYYHNVYSKKILASTWVENLQKDKTIEIIGKYYNGEIKLTDKEKESISGEFIERYHNLAKKKERTYDGTVNPIEVVLGGGGHE